MHSTYAQQLHDGLLRGDLRVVGPQHDLKALPREAKQQRFHAGPAHVPRAVLTLRRDNTTPVTSHASPTHITHPRVITPPASCERKLNRTQPNSTIQSRISSKPRCAAPTVHSFISSTPSSDKKMVGMSKSGLPDGGGGREACRNSTVGSAASRNLSDSAPTQFLNAVMGSVLCSLPARVARPRDVHRISMRSRRHPNPRAFAVNNAPSQ